MMKAILCDVTRCKACDKCVQACVETNALADALPAKRSRPDGLSSRRLVSVVEVAPDTYARKSCLHCLSPACVDACLVGAIRKTPEGPVAYDAGKCIGCRYCMLACPLGIPRYEWDQTLPSVIKCTMCADRIQDNKVPACVEACPHDALSFGDRDAMLAEAHRRIEAAPSRYVPHVYGENDMGGTCVLYVSSVSLHALGWPDAIGGESLASFTWPVISKTPIVALSVCAGLSALTWIIRRRDQMAYERGFETGNPPEEEQQIEE